MRYPNLKEEVDSLIPGCEISSLLDKKNLLGGQPPRVLWRWPIASCLEKEEEETTTTTTTEDNDHTYLVVTKVVMTVLSHDMARRHPTKGKGGVNIHPIYRK